MNLSDELLFPQTGAHTLSRHVRVTPQQARAFAEENLRKGRPGISSVWMSEEIAQQGVDRAFAQYFFPNGEKRTASFDALDNWLNKRGSWRSKPEFEFTARWDKHSSLGTVYRADGGSYAAGNTIKVVLHRMPGKSGHEGFIVYTSYPV
ncbi:RNase A-like domain-containing protein [Streptomyces sp. NPDC046859]|uniref:RNase A-like domain-containing protein n=1 Tax=Streptomyces sp. NPDC046859 TaxID=3155734 RepID=UPI003407FE95